MSLAAIFLIFIFLNYGMSNMVVYANGPFHIFSWWRETAFKIHPQLGEMFTCMICYPTWNGMLLSLVSFLIGIHFTPMMSIFNGEYWPLAILLDGCVGSGTTWVIHNIEEWFEKNSYYDVTEDNDDNDTIEVKG